MYSILIVIFSMSINAGKATVQVQNLGTEIAYFASAQLCRVQKQALLYHAWEKCLQIQAEYVLELSQRVKADDFIPEQDGEVWDFLDRVYGRKDQHPLEGRVPSSGEYLELFVPRTYRVERGDSLMKIAGKLWGDQALYTTLIEQNPYLSGDPNLILAGAELSADQPFYLPTDQRYGYSMPEFGFYTSYEWYYGYNEYGSLVLSFSGDDRFNKVFCMVREKEEQEGASFDDWEGTSAQVREYVMEHFGEAVNDLTFEHYRLADGELYMYSCLIYIYSEDNSEAIKYPLLLTAATKRTDSLQADFIGVSHLADNYDTRGEIRYMAASFAETERYQSSGIYSDHNIVIVPSFEWDIEGLFNPFDWLQALLS